MTTPILPIRTGEEKKTKFYKWCEDRKLVAGRVVNTLIDVLMEGSFDFEQFKFRYDNYYEILFKKRQDNLARGRKKLALDKSNTKK